MRYTDQQLSRILGEHSAGLLVSGGQSWHQSQTNRGCVNQAAYNEFSPAYSFRDNEHAASWFDQNYQSSMPVGKLLRKLDKDW